MLRCGKETNENHEALFRDLPVDEFRVHDQNGLRSVAASTAALTLSIDLEDCTMWTKPEFTEMRFGFEVTMYIYNR
jgi:coenzyme PQQ precursor peptide PqqA